METLLEDIRSKETHNANTIMIDVNYKSKSKMNIVNYGTRLPNVPVKTKLVDNGPPGKATKHNTSYNKTLASKVSKRMCKNGSRH